MCINICVHIYNVLHLNTLSKQICWLYNQLLNLSEAECMKCQQITQTFLECFCHPLKECSGVWNGIKDLVELERRQM